MWNKRPIHTLAGFPASIESEGCSRRFIFPLFTVTYFVMFIQYSLGFVRFEFPSQGQIRRSKVSRVCCLSFHLDLLSRPPTVTAPHIADLGRTRRKFLWPKSMVLSPLRFWNVHCAESL